jgi:hypothetical protein
MPVEKEILKLLIMLQKYITCEGHFSLTFLYHIRLLLHFKGQRLNSALLFMEVVDQDGSHDTKESLHQNDGVKLASSRPCETISFGGA